MTASASAIEARSLYRFFRAGEEETRALRGVSLTVGSGELVALVGPSGSGKSTLLSCIGGLDEPDGGKVLLKGTRLSHRPEADRALMRAELVGLLTQSANLFDHLSVAGNIRFAQGFGGHGPRRRPHELLAEVGLEHRAQAQPFELSGGEAVRVGLAVAMANSPAILLADEPTGELDSAAEQRVLELLQTVARTGTAVLVASHSPAVTRAADRVVALTDGTVDA